MIRKEEGNEERREEKKGEIGYMWVKERGERLYEGEGVKMSEEGRGGKRCGWEDEKKIEEGEWMMEEKVVERV